MHGSNTLKESTMKQEPRIPEYPRTPHIFKNANVAEDDVVITNQKELQPIYDNYVTIEEKVDGASVGLTIFNGNPIIRNRSNTLKKGYVKDTPAKKQFAPIWNYFYENKKKFEKLEGYFVYGEWMLAQHGIHYNQLPDWLIAYDLYDCEKQLFLSPMISRKMLEDAGFSVPALRFQGKFNSPIESLLDLASLPSAFAMNTPAEGVYLKVCDTNQILNRYKVVRPDFVQGALWNKTKINKNTRA